MDYSVNTFSYSETLTGSACSYGNEKCFDSSNNWELKGLIFSTEATLGVDHVQSNDD